ncbi:hypothetical protein ACJD0Z_04875 [Flavobacteriaceae bacterium M23B6Z8]
MEEQKNIKTLFVDCKEARTICNKAQYKEANFWEICKLQFHNAFCKECSSHTVSNTKLTSLCSEANLKRLDKDAKEQIRKTIELELNKSE